MPAFLIGAVVVADVGFHDNHAPGAQRGAQMFQGEHGMFEMVNHAKEKDEIEFPIIIDVIDRSFVHPAFGFGVPKRLPAQFKLLVRPPLAGINGVGEIIDRHNLPGPALHALEGPVPIVGADIEHALATLVEPETEAAPVRREKIETAKPTSAAAPPVPPVSGEEKAPIISAALQIAQKGKATAVSIPSAAEERKEEKSVTPVADLGKGGAQHKAVQDRIKEEAEKLGFRVVVEQEAPGLGQIDLVLARDDVSVACEVTVTGTIDYEVGNVSKCLKAGFTCVAVVGVSDDKLGKLAAAVTNSLGADKAKCVGYFLPDTFIASLRDLPKPQPAAVPEAIRTRGGRVVKRTIVTVSPEEATTKETQALKLMAAMMKAGMKNRERPT